MIRVAEMNLQYLKKTCEIQLTVSNSVLPTASFGLFWFCVFFRELCTVVNHSLQRAAHSCKPSVAGLSAAVLSLQMADCQPQGPLIELLRFGS